MDLIEPVTIGYLILGAAMGALLAMVALADAPRSAKEEVAAYRNGFNAGYRKGLAQSLGRPESPAAPTDLHRRLP